MRWNILIVVLTLTLILGFGVVSATSYTTQDPPGFSSTYEKATTTSNLDDWQVWYLFNNALDYTKTSDSGVTWQSVRYEIANQRINVDLGSAKTITRVKYENYFGSNGVSAGARNVAIYGSNTASDFSTTTYATDGSLELINDFEEWTIRNTTAGTSFPGYVIIDSPGSYRYYTFRISNTWGSTNFLALRHLELQSTDISPPVASFTKDKTGGTNPLTVVFTDTSTNTPTSRYWVFGDGSSTNSTMQNPVHTFSSAGTFNVNLTATNSAGSNQSATQSIVVGDAPVASFTKNVTSGTIPFYVAFTSTSTGTGSKTYYWVFADGSTSTTANPTHQFTTVGSYAVNLTVTTPYGTSQSATQTITSNQIPAPTASFTKDKTGGATPLTVQFTDTSTGAPASWYWVFGDGTTSTSASPSHQFTTGTYNVNLTATNAGGSSTTATQEITVGVVPTSSFTIADDTGATPFTAVFTFTGSGADSYLWSFGDSSTTNNTAQNPVHTFASNGDFTVHVTATNTFGSTQSSDGTVHTGMATVASFTKDKTSGVAPLDVQFTSTATGATSYYWVFGDGSTSTLESPSHQYASVGVYNANLTTFNTYSQSTSATQGITTGALPAASFTRTPNVGTAPLNVQFTSTSTGADSYYWVYGDGTTSTEQNPTHNFQYVGVYNVNLTVTNTYGSNQSSTSTIDIGLAPAEGDWNWNPAQFALTVPSGVEVNKPITFTDQNYIHRAAYAPFTYVWNAVAPNGTHIHSWSTTNPATFTPDVVGDWRFSVVVTNTYGSTADTDYWWTIRYPYNLAVSATPTSVGIPYTTTYSVTNVGGNTMSTYLWVGEDGWTSTSASPTRSITTAGAHTANVTVYFNALGTRNTSQVNTVTGLVPPTNVLWTANVSDTVPQTTTADRYVKFTPTFDGTQTGATYWWDIHGQHNFANGQISSDEYEPVLEIWGGQGAVESGYGWINLTVTTSAGVAVYNDTYNMNGLKPKVGSVTPSTPSGSSYPGTDVRYAIAYDSLNGAFPYNITVNYGDGSMYYYGDVVPTVHSSTLYPYITTPYHIYATAGVKTVTVTSTNIWGVETITQSYTVIPVPALPLSTLRWSKQDGGTITSANINDLTYFTFATVSNGQNPPYIGNRMDVFYIRLFKLDTSTNSYIELPQPQGLITQAYGFMTYNTNSPITLTPSNVDPYYGYDASGMISTTFSGSNWTGSVPYTPTTAGTYRMYLIGASLDPYDPITEYYTYGYKDLVVTGKPLDVAATGDWATNFGGEALKLVIAVIVMIAAIGVPFAITREFNPYIEIVAAILGIGVCYVAGLIPIWVIIGMVVMGAVVIFFMSRSGGDNAGGGGEAMG
jgi:PKD repeat protein